MPEIASPTSAAERYQARFHRVLRHVEEHLADDLSVERLSGIAAFSKFHFHRQFTGLVGIGVHKYVQLLRLKRASYRLAFRTDDPILQIALDSGYEGPEAFARSFKQRFGQTPSEFRARPQWATWNAVYQSLRDIRTTHMKQDLQSTDVRIVETKDIRVAVLEHRGDPATIGDSVRRFIAWRKEAHLPPRTNATFNIFYDDPEATPPGEFRVDLCVAVDREIALNNTGIVMKTIPGGRCAVLRHVGSDDGLAAAAQYLYGVWLPASGEELRDFPLYGQRVAFFPDVPENEAILDLFLPLK